MGRLLCETPLATLRHHTDFPLVHKDSTNFQDANGCASGFWQAVPSAGRTGDRIDPTPEARMNAATLDAMTPLQRPIVERALTLAKELEAAADSAQVGRVI